MNKLYNANSLDIFYKIVNENHDKNIILVSDPPFNINYKYNTYNDNMDEDEYYEDNYMLFVAINKQIEELGWNER